MKLHKTTTIFLIFGLFMVAYSAPPRHKGPRLHEMLNLTEEQKDKLWNLQHDKKKERRKHFREMRTIKKAIKEELQKESPSQARLNTLAGQIGEQHKKMSLMETEFMLKAKKILSPEQFTKLLNFKEKRREAMKNRMKHRKGQHFKGNHGKKCDTCQQH